MVFMIDENISSHPEAYNTHETLGEVHILSNSFQHVKTIPTITDECSCDGKIQVSKSCGSYQGFGVMALKRVWGM